MGKKNEWHPFIPELFEQFKEGKISRREFLRYAALLGISVSSASNILGFHRPKRLFAAKILRGGTLRVSASVQKVTHPAQFSWIMPSNQLRQVAEYLTFTDADNITHPYLLENWMAGENLKTWT